uniref:Uncharacterized protein n=1 Tax=Knipowitschia caucasica TaxID=637954 RepID=A0AAV2KFV5_KNICA
MSDPHTSVVGSTPPLSVDTSPAGRRHLPHHIKHCIDQSEGFSLTPSTKSILPSPWCVLPSVGPRLQGVFRGLASVSDLVHQRRTAMKKKSDEVRTSATDSNLLVYHPPVSRSTTAIALTPLSDFCHL